MDHVNCKLLVTAAPKNKSNHFFPNFVTEKKKNEGNMTFYILFIIQFVLIHLNSLLLSL